MNNSEQPAMRITLDRSALERLIGNDANIELLLSKNAVQTLIGRYEHVIRDKIDQMAKQVTGEALQEAIAAKLGRLEKQARGTVEHFVPSTFLQDSINRVLGPIIDQKLREIVAEQMQHIEEIINRVASAYGKSEIQKQAKILFEKAINSNE